MEAAKFLDAKGFACPMPVVRTKKAMDGMAQGEVLEIHTTDKGSIKDMAAWAASTGNELVKQTEEDGVYKFWIEKA
ncbi:sulfurtransferase TusA family protein [Mesobacillus zeae]|uniref:Sulfurtransferase TusA family protein n=1 Tax=Mesobacillus zeae TaxID=1917180 RepID=A0A398BEQ8_9BACI|nr:sulfurtransferase TusA family protein [Mesobacillus zeae]RID88829.1 sulfurtransferase TusA family protein [Mesobacillus zeae]